MRAAPCLRAVAVALLLAAARGSRCNSIGTQCEGSSVVTCACDCANHDVLPCANRGTHDESCRCACPTPWAGSQCTTCTRDPLSFCTNGGHLNVTTCNCACTRSCGHGIVSGANCGCPAVSGAPTKKEQGNTGSGFMLILVLWLIVVALVFC